MCALLASRIGSKETFRTAILLSGLIAVVVFIVFSPIYTPSFAPSLYDGARSLELFALSQCAIVALYALTSKRLFNFFYIKPPIRKAVIGFFALACMSAACSSSPLDAMAEVALTWLLVALLIMVVILFQPRPVMTDRVLMAAYYFSALVFGTIFLISYCATTNADASFNWYNHFIGFGNVRHFSQFQAYTLPLITLPMLLAVVPLRWRAVIFLIAAMWWGLQFAVGTRSVWLAASAAAILLSLFLRSESYRWLLWQAKTLLAGAFIYFASQHLFLTNDPGLGSVLQRGFDGSGRWELWRAALGMIKESPLLGVGPMHYSFQNFGIAAHPHNAALQIASEYGLPAMCLVGLLVAYLLMNGIAWCKKSSGENRHINIALLASLLTGLTDSLLTGNNLMPHSQFTLYVVAGWLIGRNVRIQATMTEVQLEALSPRILMVALTAIALVTIVCYSGLYLQKLKSDTTVVLGEIAHPRFWQNGHWPVR
ncbi:MAG: O-antigen ligase family protein [Burkholderiales bacterium]